MQITWEPSRVMFKRSKADGDARVSRESTVAYRLKHILNQQGHTFKRCDPRKFGLTDCRVGLIDRKAGVILWHEKYQIQDLAKDYNQYRICYLEIVKL